MPVVASKRHRSAAQLVDRTKIYPIAEALQLLAQLPKTKFNETVELSMHLDLDAKQADVVVRGTVVLPHGTGTSRRVIVFCKGERVSEAQAAGADAVGGLDLIEKVSGGWMEFDVAVATPDLMKDVSRLGRLLGPRGLMPSPKAGTVADDVAKAVKEVKGGRIEFKMDKQANMHVVIGKRSFQPQQLVENAQTVLDAIVRAKPTGVKGRFLTSATVSSTMSPGIRIDVSAYATQESAT